MKTIQIFVDNVPKFNIEVSKNTLVGNIKTTLHKYIGPNYTIRMFLNPQQTELNVFNVNTYDNNDISSVYDSIENGYIMMIPVPVNIQPEGKYGKIRIAQQQRARSYPSVPGYETIPAWSRGAGEWKQLSPFYLKFADGTIFENFFQSFKVWEKVDKQNKKDWKWPAENHVDINKNPNQNWLRWHEALLHHNLPVRRPNGKAVPLYAYWNNQKLNTIEGRKQIYIPYLKQLYRANPVYHKLLEKVRNGKNIIIVEPDGPLLDAYPNGLEVDLVMLYNLIDRMNYAPEGHPNRYRPYGHGYVLAMTMLEDL